MPKKIEIEADFIKKVLNGESLVSASGKKLDVCTFEKVPKSDHDRYGDSGEVFRAIFVDIGGATLSLSQSSEISKERNAGVAAVTARTDSIKAGMVAVFIGPDNILGMQEKDSFLSDYKPHASFKEVPVEKATISAEDLVLAQSKPAKPAAKVASSSGKPVGHGNPDKDLPIYMR